MTLNKVSTVDRRSDGYRSSINATLHSCQNEAVGLIVENFDATFEVLDLITIRVIIHATPLRPNPLRNSRCLR